jgi:glycosyltransferase involved in cell wall biosynthesis
MMRLASVVVANSRAGLAAWGMRPPKGRVVYNAMDPGRLAALVSPGRAPGSSSPEAPRDRFTAVMTGRMRPDKDFQTVIAAARLLAGAPGPQAWKFVLVGDGPQRDSLELEARDLVESGVVEFADAGLEVLPLVAGADVGVLMTNDDLHAEGCSNSIMEYMACALPVVCCDSGGNRELVADGISGWLVAPGDPYGLAARLEQLRVSGAAARMGAAGRDILGREFTLARMVDAYADIYEGCLRDGPAGDGSKESASCR